MKRVKLIVAYDGTNYCGWQVQPNGITIEEELNKALSQLLGEKIHVIGASRTDSGVHSRGSVAVFDTEAKMPADKISFALNQRLPEDIVVQDSKEVPLDFHPRYAKSTKTYEYKILNRTFAMPTIRKDTYFFHRKLNVEAMQQAAKILVGKHDFKSFCSIHTSVENTVRTILDLSVEKDAEDVIHIKITGTGFLYNMVRIIAGTLIQIGTGEKSLDDMKTILNGKDRNLAGPTAPALGLTMIETVYQNEKENS